MARGKGLHVTASIHQSRYSAQAIFRPLRVGDEYLGMDTPSKNIGPGCLGIFWLLLGLAVVGGGVVAVVMIPQHIDSNLQIPCDPTVSPLHVTGTYHGSFSCDGVSDSGVFTETASSALYYVEQATATTVRIYDSAAGIMYNGVIPASANMAARPEIGFWASSPAETGRWEVFQTCSATDGTIAHVVLTGESVQAGTHPATYEKYTETCFDRLERVSATVPGGIFPPPVRSLPQARRGKHAKA